MLLTSAEVAHRLGVGTTAVKRWTDHGLLPCVRTPGGHRRYRALDIERFARTGAGRGGADDPWGEWIETLVDSGNVHAVLSRLFAERAQRSAWHEVATLLGQVLEAIGERWARGTLTVAQEHIASSALQRAVALLVETIHVPASGRRCLLATAEGEEHTLGLTLAELCLRESGWRAEWTGSHTRSVDVCERVRAGSVQMVALSASSYLGERRRLRTQVRIVGSTCQRAAVPLVLGGCGNWPDPPPFGLRLTQWDQFHALAVRLQQPSAGA